MYLDKTGLSFSCKYVNNDLVLNSRFGGVFGDPYDSIEIDNGALHVRITAASSDRWAHDFIFKYDQNDLILEKVTKVSYSTHTLNGTISYFDFTNGTVNSYSMIRNGDISKRFDNLQLYNGSFKLAKLINFVSTTSWYEQTIKVEPSYPMPSLWVYGADGFKDYSVIMKSGTNEILDLIRKKYTLR